MRKWVVFWLFVILSPLSYLPAYDASPPCFRELETNFFKQILLYQALSLHHVYQSQWSPIYQDLVKRSADIPRTVRDKASRMHRNPLQDPFQKDVAVDILRQTLYDAFVEVLKIHNITNESDIKDMFNYIQERQPEYLRRCMIVEPQANPS